MLLKLYIIFSSILTTSNVKPQNYKVLDLIGSYNFDIKSIFIWPHTKKYYFSNATSTITRLLCCWNFVLFFEHRNVPKWKNLKLKSCRSHRALQFSYKNHLHPTFKFSLVTPLARQGFTRRKRFPTWHILPRQRMWRGSVIWSCQRD
jgi:hypothetical protein